jgi:hypothetical protein
MHVHRSCIPFALACVGLVASCGGSDSGDGSGDDHNQKPVASAVGYTLVRVGHEVVLDGSGSYDPDGAPLTYSWSFVSIPHGSEARLDNATTVAPSFVADREGRYLVSLTVSDGKATSAPAKVTVAATNRLVVDAGPDLEATVGELVLLDGSRGTSGCSDGTPPDVVWSVTSRLSGSDSPCERSGSSSPSFRMRWEPSFWTTDRYRPSPDDRQYLIRIAR